MIVVLNREELGILVQKPSYKTSMKIITNVQKRIEGWEVRKPHCVYYVYVACFFDQNNMLLYRDQTCYSVLLNLSWVRAYTMQLCMYIHILFYRGVNSDVKRRKSKGC